MVWFAGLPEVPQQRWMVCEATPVAYVPHLLELLLAQPIRNAEARTGWAYYQRTRCILSPFWVIQGSDIGHKYKYSIQESQARESLGFSGEAPAIGMRRYAEPSDRTWPVLAEQALTRRYRLVALAKAHEQRETDYVLAQRRGVIALGNDVVDATRDAAPAIMDGALSTRVDDRTLADGNASEDDAYYLETGQVPLDPVAMAALRP